MIILSLSLSLYLSRHRPLREFIHRLKASQPLSYTVMLPNYSCITIHSWFSHSNLHLVRGFSRGYLGKKNAGMVSPQPFSALRSSSASFLAPPAAGASSAWRAARCSRAALRAARRRALRARRCFGRPGKEASAVEMSSSASSCTKNDLITRIYPIYPEQKCHPCHLAAVCGAPAFAPLAGHPRQPLLAQRRPRPGAAGRAQQATAQVEQGVHGGNCRGLHAALTAGFMVDISNYSEWMWIWVMKQLLTGLCLARGVCMVLEA